MNQSISNNPPYLARWVDLTEVENSSSIQAYHQYCKGAAKEFGAESPAKTIAFQLGNSDGETLANIVSLDSSKKNNQNNLFSCKGALDFNQRALQVEAIHYVWDDQVVEMRKSTTIKMKDADFLAEKLLVKKEEEEDRRHMSDKLGLALLILIGGFTAIDLDVLSAMSGGPSVLGFLEFLARQGGKVKAAGILGRIPSFLGSAGAAEVATAGVGATAAAVTTGLAIGVGLGYLIENAPRWLGAKKSVSDGIAWGLEKVFGPADRNGNFFKFCEFLGLA